MYRNGENEFRFALPVNAELRRGSGQTLAPGLAHALGVDPGQQRTLTNPDDGTTITAVWHMSATNGASIGSLRELAASLGAQLGDTLLLVFRPAAAEVAAVRIPVDTSAPQRLELLLGRSVGDPIAALAGSLDCRPDEVYDLLDRRGERHILYPATGS